MHKQQSPTAPQQGFTLTELVTVIVILGVLSVVAMPLWFNRTDFEQRGYFDELIQSARYAQKLAVATNCEVRITINAANFTIEQPTSAAQCGSPATWQTVELPAKQPPYNAPAGVTVTAGTGAVTFLASGLASTTQMVTVNGALSFRIHAATGYVERL